MADTSSEYLQIPFDQFGPDRPESHIAQFLASNSPLNIWKWNLLLQDEVFYPAEKQFLECLGFFEAGKGKVLDLSWGKGHPVASRVQKFSQHDTHEIGISYDYLFSNSAKAKKILADVSSGLKSPDQRFDWIRIYLVAQMVRHHGVLLEGLGALLNEGGRVLIFDTRDEFLDFNPSFPHMRDLYQRLKDYQLTQGGIRDAAERIKKRTADFGFRLLDSENLRVQTHTQTDRDHFFRMFCIHVELITRWFPNRFDREQLFKDVKRWHQDPKCWGSLGLQCVAIQKKTRFGRRKG